MSPILEHQDEQIALQWDPPPVLQLQISFLLAPDCKAVTASHSRAACLSCERHRIEPAHHSARSAFETTDLAAQRVIFDSATLVIMCSRADIAPAPACLPTQPYQHAAAAAVHRAASPHPQMHQPTSNSTSPHRTKQSLPPFALATIPSTTHSCKDQPGERL